MIIATRILTCRLPHGETSVPIHLYTPEASKGAWICRFEIGWPEGKAERWGTGTDSIQALLIAMQMIGAELYASSYHASGRLEWMAPGHGYGFPVAATIKDLLVGDDRRFF